MAISDNDIVDACLVLSDRAKKLYSKEPNHELIINLDKYYNRILYKWFSAELDHTEGVNENIMDGVLGWIYAINDELERKYSFENPSPSENIIKKSQLKLLIKEILRSVEKLQLNEGGETKYFPHHIDGVMNIFKKLENGKNIIIFYGTVNLFVISKLDNRYRVYFNMGEKVRQKFPDMDETQFRNFLIEEDIARYSYYISDDTEIFETKKLNEANITQLPRYGKWIEPNGTTHDLREFGEDDTHWSWAEKYLESIKSEKRFSDNPYEELIKRGWMRVNYDYHDYIIYVEINKNSAWSWAWWGRKKQLEAIEDEAEKREWAVVDNNTKNTIYTPRHCMSIGIHEDHGLGYSHNVSFNDTPKERDPLNDPLLTNKLSESVYEFHDFDDMNVGDEEGLNVPSDVYYGAIGYLGTIATRSEGRYAIIFVKGPMGNNISMVGRNYILPTKEKAAMELHRLWKLIRNNRRR